MPKCAKGSISVSATAAQWRTRRKGLLGGWGAWSAWGAIPGAAAFLPFNIGPFRYNTCTCPKGQKAVLTNCVALPAITIPVPWTSFPISSILGIVQVQVRVMGTITLNITVCDLKCVKVKKVGEDKQDDSGDKKYFYYVTESPDAPPPDVLADEGLQSDLVAFVKARLGDDVGQLLDEYFVEQGGEELEADPPQRSVRKKVASKKSVRNKSKRAKKK